MSTLLTREQFRKKCLERDGFGCVVPWCGREADEGEIVDVDDQTVIIKYITIENSMGSMVKKPKLVDVPKDQIEMK